MERAGNRTEHSQQHSGVVQQKREHTGCGKEILVGIREKQNTNQTKQTLSGL